MPELENVEAQKTAGYMSRSRSKYKDKIKKEEEELKQLMEQQGKPQEEQKVEEKTEEAKPEVELSDEEKSFKTRYGDMRRHLAAKEKEYNAKIKELEDKLGETKKLVPPKSDEDLQAWVDKYPDVAGMVETIADKRAKQMFDKKNSTRQKKKQQGVVQRMKLGKRMKILISFVIPINFIIGLKNSLNGCRTLCTKIRMTLLRLYVLLICIKLIMDLPDRIRKIKQKLLPRW